jgi:hypothetical protein
VVGEHLNSTENLVFSSQFIPSQSEESSVGSPGNACDK